MLSPGRLHVAGTVLMLHIPLFICTYLLLYMQVRFSTRQQANRITALFTPDLQTPHTSFTRLPATLSVLWDVSTHLCYPWAHCLVYAMSTRSAIIHHLLRDASAILRELFGKYLLCHHTMTIRWPTDVCPGDICHNGNVVITSKLRHSIGST